MFRVGRYLLLLVSVAPAELAHAADHDPPAFQLVDQKRPVSRCAFSPDGKLVATAGADKTVRLWEMATGKELQHWEQPGPILTLTFAPDGRSLAASCGGKEPALTSLDVAKGKVIWRVTVGQAPVTAVAYSDNGKVFAVGFGCSVAHLSPATGKTIGVTVKAQEEDRQTITALAVQPGANPKNCLVASGGNDREIGSWRITGDDPGIVSVNGLGEFRAPDRKAAKGPVAMSPGEGERRVAGACQEKGVLIWLTLPQLLQQISVPDSAHSLGFRPDGKVLAVGTDRAVILYDPTTGKELRQLVALQRKVHTVSFSADGKQLLSLGEDGHVLVWDLTRKAGPRAAGQKKPDEKKLEELWTDLGSDEGDKAYAAWDALGACPAESLPLLSRHLQAPAATEQSRQIAKLIAQLDADDFDAREQATGELAKMGRFAESALRRARAAKPSAEVASRLEGLLSKLPPTEALSAEQEHERRAVLVLESIGTPEARAILERSLVESPGWWVTREARDALRRRGSQAPRR